VDRHTLRDTAFAALGAGRPDAATLAELRRAQFGKHLLLLREIAREDPDFWYAAEQADPEGFRRRVADPLFGAWAAARLRARRADSHQGEAGRPAGNEEGRPRETAEGEGGGPETAGSHRPPAADPARWLVAEEDGLTFRVRLEDRDPARALLGLTPAGALADAGAARWQDCLAGAWRMLVRRHRAAAETLAAVVTVLVPVEPDPAARGISATSADAFGAVAMSAPDDVTAMAVGLLHEAQHSILNATTYLFDLLERPDELGYSPWRDDPRPASGILHGAYAYLAVTRFWRAEADGGSRLAAFEFARWRAAVAAAVENLGPLTPAGRRFVGALRDEVRPWLDEPVDPEIERLSRIANADHRLRWRLRNLTVDPDDLDRLGQAWRAGGPPPEVRARLRPGTRRAFESSDRLDLIHATVKGDHPPRPGGRATAGDIALLRGDHGTAECAYLEGDVPAWTGLALATGHGDRLELARAVARREGADPLAVLRWFGRT
jgi:hypothetical protein